MNSFLEYYIPAAIILIANIFSGEYGSNSYENITALFGWTSCIALFISLISPLALLFYPSPVLETTQQISSQVFILSSITALSRDFEKILKPKAHYFRSKIKWLDRFLNRRK
jgi:hypothetical protein